jgi:hypothetical protein
VRNKKLATTALEPPLRDWLRVDEGRKALAMWAVWDGKLGLRRERSVERVEN